MKTLDAPVLLTPGERRVLQIFRQFLMQSGDMLCFGSKELEEHRTGLATLNRRGLLVAEARRGAYSLTKQGLMAMRSASARNAG